MSERKTPQELAAEVWAAIEADENAALAPNAVAMMHVAAALSASEARAADLDRKLTTTMRAGMAMSEAHEAALARVAASEARATAAEEHSRGLESALQIMGEENAKIERERDEARRALREVARRGSLPIKVDGVWPNGAAEHTCRVIGEAVDWITEPARALSGAGAEEGRHTAASHPGEER
jgi:hypothetical protein